MSILIGLKKQSAGGTFNGVDGLEGFSMEGTSFNIIKEGAREDLESWVASQKDIEKHALAKLKHLYDLSDREDSSIMILSEKQWDAKLKKHQDKLILCRHDKLMIIEGTTIDSKL
jgi:hypothetical protein